MRCGWPSIASSAEKVRPRAASAPRTEKKSAVTMPIRSCSGSESPVRAAVFAQIAPKPEKRVERSRRSASSGPESGARGYPSSLMSDQTKASREGSWYGRGAIRTAWTTLKMAVLPPMPRASVRTVTAAKPGAFQRPRQA